MISSQQTEVKNRYNSLNLGPLKHNSSHHVRYSSTKEIAKASILASQYDDEVSYADSDLEDEAKDYI